MRIPPACAVMGSGAPCGGIGKRPVVDCYVNVKEWFVQVAGDAVFSSLELLKSNILHALAGHRGRAPVNPRGPWRAGGRCTESGRVDQRK